jgi:hypothetical protein
MSNGTSVAGGLVLKGSVCPHPRDARRRSHARSLPGSCCTASHRHVSLVCQRMDVRVGDVDGMDPYTNNSTPSVSRKKRYQAMRQHVFM